MIYSELIEYAKQIGQIAVVVTKMDRDNFLSDACDVRIGDLLKISFREDDECMSFNSKEGYKSMMYVPELEFYISTDDESSFSPVNKDLMDKYFKRDDLTLNYMEWLEKIAMQYLSDSK